MSGFRYDSTGVNPDGYSLLPDNTWHVLEIDEALEMTSKSGHPMVKCVCVPVDPDYVGVRIWHYVTFLPPTEPGAGIAVHWLKTIGEPWEGSIAVKPQSWCGQRFLAYVTQEEYKGKKNNKISKVQSSAADPPSDYDDPFAN